MKSVLISIRPKWCELIANSKKTVEVRKTKPKLDTPFKVYIYETRAQCDRPIMLDFGALDFHGRGQVIGEFVCDCVFIMWDGYAGNQGDDCLTFDEREKYLQGKGGYGWHISNLVIYDNPKYLTEFKKFNRECWYADLGLAKIDCPECKNAECFMQRPPESWCYVEETEV